MAFEFINNQPIRFNSSKFDDQACINKDLSAYSILMQLGDPLHWQAKLRCCDDNEACEPFTEGAELVTDGDMSNPASFLTGAGWAVGAGVATYTAPGTGALGQNIAIVTGRPYVVRFDVNNNSTNFGIDVYIGGRRIGAVPIAFTGPFEFYGTAGTTGQVELISRLDYGQATTGSLQVDNLSVKSLAACYTFDTSTRQYVVNGTFTGTEAGWTLDANWAYNANNILHTAGVSDSAIQGLIGITNRHDYQLGLTVGGAAGTVSVIFGTVNMQTYAAGSGAVTFTFKLFALINSTLEILANSAFDGTVDNIFVEETTSGWQLSPGNGFCHTPGWANPFYAGNTLTVGRYYKITVEIIVNAGTVLIEAGGVVLGTVDKTDVYDFYFTSLTTAGERFTPSVDFDGCVLPTIDICFLFRDTLQARLVYSDGITGATDWHDITSSSNPLILDEDWVTWRVNSLAAILSGGIPVALPYSCFRVQVKLVCDVLDPPSVTTTTSDTIINYKETHDCTKLFMAYCEGDALDFRFGYQGNMFRLYSRLRTLYFNPSYPVDSQDYNFSSGVKKRIYAELTKTYELLFDRMDEYAHDVVWLFHGCDLLYIDNAGYIITSGNYEPEWAERGKRNLAQSIIELQKADGILFNRNCS